MGKLHEYTFDIECYPNIFTVGFINNHDSDDRLEFIHCEETGQKCQTELRYFLNQRGLILNGYNNYRYDNVLLNRFWIDKPVTNNGLHQISQLLIGNEWFNYPDWLKELSNSRGSYQSVDLQKILEVGYNRPPLKWVAVHLKWPTLKELPFDPYLPIPVSEIPRMTGYMWNDIGITNALRQKLEEVGSLPLRRELTKMYGTKRIVSASDSAIANAVMDKLYGRYTGDTTERPSINTIDLLPSHYRFDTPALKALEDKIRSSTIYFDTKYKFEYPVKIGDSIYDFKSGGLHSRDGDKPGVFRSSPKLIVRDADVTSFYPTLVISEGICPAHLDKNKFLTIYAQILAERVQAKSEANTAKADGLKITANSIFGKFNYPGYWLYDPLCAFQVTFGGQIYQLDLIEKMELAGIEVISANTDGIVCTFHPSMEPIYEAVCQEWQERTGYSLEFTDYQVYARRDVNNYFSIKPDGKMKTKGCFVDKLELDQKTFTKGFEAPVVALALQVYFGKGTLPEEFIPVHQDVLDFCYSQKMDRKFKMKHISSAHDDPVGMQRFSRWYASIGGGRVEKSGGVRKSAVQKGQNVRLLEDVADFVDDIDYTHYIKEAYKIITPITGDVPVGQARQLGLF